MNLGTFKTEIDKSYNIILPYNSYIRNTTGSMQYMDYETVILFICNVVSSIAVNIISSDIYDKYFSNRNSLITQNKLDKILNELNNSKEQEKVDIKDLKNQLQNYLNCVGLPEEESSKLSNELEPIIQELIDKNN